MRLPPSQAPDTIDREIVWCHALHEHEHDSHATQCRDARPLTTHLSHHQEHALLKVTDTDMVRVRVRLRVRVRVRVRVRIRVRVRVRVRVRLWVRVWVRVRVRSITRSMHCWGH